MSKDTKFEKLFASLKETDHRTGSDKIIKLIDELHRLADDPDKKKKLLREKDQQLVDSIQTVQVYGHLLIKDFAIFLGRVLLTFDLIERILWELKGEEGNPPKPTPLPEPTPPEPTPPPPPKKR